MGRVLKVAIVVAVAATAYSFYEDYQYDTLGVKTTATINSIDTIQRYGKSGGQELNITFKDRQGFNLQRSVRLTGDNGKKFITQFHLQGNDQVDIIYIPGSDKVRFG